MESAACLRSKRADKPLDILLRKIRNFEILHKVKNETLLDHRLEESANSLSFSVSARSWGVARIPSWLVIAAFCAIGSIPAAPQTKSERVETLLKDARGEENTGNYASAERFYRQALAIAPESLESLKRLGILEQTELKFDDSIQLFERVLASDPSFPQVNFFLGASYFGKSDFPRAIESFERELKALSPHPRTHYYLALALQSSGRVEEAISQLNQSFAENPKDADALYELARIYKNASLRSIEMLKTLDPDSFQLHALMGEVYADQERYSEAIEEYQAALVKRPDAPGIHFVIGVAYWAQRQMEPAEKAFNYAYKENPNDPMTNLYLGDIAVRYQRFSDALPFLVVAHQAQPNMPQVHVLLGQCYQSQKELQKAKDEFLAAIDADPGAAQPHYLLARVYRELHDTQASADELSEFERLSTEKEKSSQHNPQN
jgi:superkiller protein 3